MANLPVKSQIQVDGSAVREHAFLCAGVFEGVGPHDHLSGHSRRAVEERPAPAGLAGSRGEPPGGVVRSASRGGLRPDVGRRAHTDGARATECARVRQEKCRDIHPIGKSSLSVFGCSFSSLCLQRDHSASRHRSIQRVHFPRVRRPSTTGPPGSGPRRVVVVIRLPNRR
jgi:hypothetical protein